MNVSIWNKITKKWIEVNNVDFITMNVCDKEFKLDDIVYNTNIYEINFIHSR